MLILLFDIDGTLLLSGGAGSLAMQQAIAREFQLSKPDTAIPFAGRTDHALIQELLAKNELPIDQNHHMRFRDRYVAELPMALPKCNGCVLPGVTDLLTRLAADEQIRSYVMTGNLQATATLKLQHFGLLDHFCGVFGGDDDAHRDDLARRSARSLRQHHGIGGRDSIVVVGDTPADIRCGHAIGAHTIAVCTGSFDREQLQAESPLAVFNDLSDTERFFQCLEDTAASSGPEQRAG